MTKRIGLAFLTFGVVALLSSYADAGCINLSSGGRYCAAWITGSEICFGRATGISQDSQILCQAGGTFVPPLTDPPTESDACNNDFNNFPTGTDQCGISGLAFCTNHGNFFNPGGNSPFTITNPISGVTNLFGCKKNGTCDFTIELQVPQSFAATICPNRNWTLDFTAEEFKARSCVCEHGSYTFPSGQLPVCSGIETCQVELCQVDLTGFQPHETRTYSCSTLPPPSP
jgi:hypothetical protein